MGNGSSAPPRRPVKSGGARARFEPPREMAPAEKGKMQAVRRNRARRPHCLHLPVDRTVWFTPRGVCSGGNHDIAPHSRPGVVTGAAQRELTE